ncbi:MAG TPA: SGNH/GDSL hydrolase family protein [Acetobacteraceae bacterium]|nr:SGNH/GDSL hydrolase family protein [Acetobacteraceae bacterium]
MALRINQIITFGTVATVEKAAAFHIDPETGLRLPVPGAVEGKIRINQLGYRGPEPAMPKPPGRIRVAFLGSSTTYDPYVPRDDGMWSAVATAKLNAAFAPSCQFDYVNAGVPGFGTKRLTEYLVDRVYKTQPDIVVVDTDDINGRLNDLAISAGLYQRTHYQPSMLAHASLFWAKLEKNAVVLRLQRTAHSQTGKLKVTPDELNGGPFKQELSELITAIRSFNAQPVLVLPGGELRSDQSPAAQTAAADVDLLYMPYMSIDGLLEAKDSFEQQTIKVADRMKAPFLRWTDEVPGTREDFVDSHHFSAAGARLMGTAIGTRMLADPTMQTFFASRGCHASS